MGKELSDFEKALAPEDRRVYRRMWKELSKASYLLARREAILKALETRARVEACCEYPYRQPWPAAFSRSGTAL